MRYSSSSQPGAGFARVSYTVCLEHELRKAGLKVEREKPVALVYDDLKIECAYRIDLMVDDTIVVELKTVDKLDDVHVSQ